MEFRTLATFLKAAELGSFSAAAKALGYSQSTVTMQIQQLEGELGVPLFDRVGRTVSITPAGEKLTGYAKTLFQLEAMAKHDLRQSKVQGRLQIGLAESLCSVYFPRILQRYHQLYPDVEIKLLRGGQDDLFQLINHNKVDLLYTLDQPIYQSELEILLRREEPLCFVASSQHDFAQAETLSLEDLLHQDFLLTEREMSYRGQLDRLLASRQLVLTPFLELGDIVLIRQLVEENLGLSFLPWFAVQESIEAGRLVRLEVPDCSVTVWRQLLRRRDKFVTPQMQAMIDLMLQMDSPAKE